MTPADAPFVLEILNDPDFVRFIGDRAVRTLGAAQQYIRERVMTSYERHGYGLYAVDSRNTGEGPAGPLGMCGLLRRDYLDAADIGFAFLQRYRGHGLAAEAIAEVVRHAREDCGLERLAAIVNPDNAVSIRLLERIGMRFERTLQPPEGGPAVGCYGMSLR